MVPSSLAFFLLPELYVYAIHHVKHLLPLTRLLWLVSLRLELVVKELIHRQMPVPVLFVEESPMPHVHQLRRSIKISVAGTVNANHTT